MFSLVKNKETRLKMNGCEMHTKKLEFFVVGFLSCELVQITVKGKVYNCNKYKGVGGPPC